MHSQLAFGLERYWKIRDGVRKTRVNRKQKSQLPNISLVARDGGLIFRDICRDRQKVKLDLSLDLSLSLTKTAGY